MLRAIVVGAAFAYAASCPVHSSQPPAVQHPYSIQDYLRLEDFGNAVIDPTGRWLVYERMPPYEERPDFSVGRIATWDSGGGRLMVVDLSDPSLRSRLLFSPDSEGTYWIDGFSPDGKHLAFYQSLRGHVSLGIFTFQVGRVTTFEPAPRVDWINGHTSVWTADGRAIYSAVAENGEPAALSLRRYTADRFAQEWRKAWRGKEPSVSVVTSRPDGYAAELDGRLVIADPNTQQATVLGRGQYDDIQLSPDGRYLAAARLVRQAQPEPRELEQDWLVTRTVLSLWDLEQRSASQTFLEAKNVYPGSLTWSPDSSRLAVFAWKEGRGVRSGMFHALDVRRRRIYEYPHYGLDLASERERGYFQRPERAVWLGERLAVVARATESRSAEPQFTYRDLSSRMSRPLSKADWFLIGPDGSSQNLTAAFNNVSAVPVSALNNSLFVMADGQVWSVQGGKHPRRITSQSSTTLMQPDWVVDSAKRSPFGRSAVLEQKGAAGKTYLIIDLMTRATWLSPAASSATPLAASASALVFREETENGAEMVLVRADKVRHPLDKINEHLSQVAKPAWKTIRYADKDGQQLEGCVLVPPDYKPGMRYPAVVEVYPGRLDAEHGPMCLNPAARHLYSLGAKPGAYSLHLLSGHGYIVMMPATPSERIRTARGPIGGITKLVELGADALVANNYADPDRIGLFGMSQGAFAALWIATQTGRFRAVVSVNGWADMWSHYFQGASAFTRFYPEEFPYVGDALRYESVAGSDYGIGQSPWDDPLLYIRNSPLFLAKQITTPVMLLHSDMDAFPMEQYDQMFTALYRQRKEAEFVRYWGEGHGPSSPANIRDMWERIFGWYDRHLRPVSVLPSE